MASALPMSMTRAQHAARPHRESLSKRLGAKARRIRERDDNCCVYCGATEGPMHLDHVVARALGGKDEPGNLLVSCAACNCVKRHLTLRQWYSYLRVAYGWTPQQTTACARRVRRHLAKAI